MKDNKEIELFKIKFQTKFPNIGEIMEIEALKHKMAGGTYKDMASTNTIASRFNLDLVDAIATFSVIFPKFRKKVSAANVNSENIFDLPAILSKDIVKVYRKDFYPWYEEFLIELYEESEETTEESKKD